MIEALLIKYSEFLIVTSVSGYTMIILIYGLFVMTRGMRRK